MKEILFQLDRSAPAGLQAQLRERIVNAILIITVLYFGAVGVWKIYDML